MTRRIAEPCASAKSRAPQTIPCCKCSAHHPKDPATRRMREHTHQGRRCLGSDIPFAKHGEPPIGKLVGCIVSQVPMPNRARAIQIAEHGGVDQRVIDQLLAEPWQHDLDLWFWCRHIRTIEQMVELDATVAPLRPKLRAVRERTARA